MKFRNLLVCLLLAAVFASPAGAEPRKSFDYYVMSLSWSPEFCDTLKQRIKTPPALQNLAKPLRTDTKQLTQFVVAANPGLAADAVAISCTGKQRYLEEIYVCYDSSGAKAISCAEDVQKKA